MNPLRIRAANYRTFEQLDVELPAGCVGILGLNGAGKSSIVNVLDLALFGPEGRSWAPYLTVGAAGTELMVELVFEHAGELYRVRRGYSARGAGKSTLDLERFEGEPTIVVDGRGEHVEDLGGFVSLTLGSAKETQALLEQILGFTRRTLRASSLLLQGDGAAFTEADPRDRKKILADTLGLDRFEQLLAAVRRDRRAAEQEIQRIDGRLEGVTRDELLQQKSALHGVAADCSRIVALANTALTAWEARLDDAAKAVAAANDAAVQRVAATARRDAAAAALAAKVRIKEEAIEAEKNAAAAREELAKIPVSDVAAIEQLERDLRGRLEAHTGVLRDREQTIKLRELRAAEAAAIDAQVRATKAKRDELDVKIAHLETGELDSCPTCKQALGAEARAETIGTLRALAQQAQEEASALVEQAAMIEIPEIPDEPTEPTETVTRPGEEGEAGVELSLTAAIALVRSSIDTGRQHELDRARIEERLLRYQADISMAVDPMYLGALDACEAELREVDAEVAALPPLVDIAPLEAAALEARGRVAIEHERLQTAEREKAVAQERLDQLTARADQLERDLADREKHQAEIDLLAVLERAYGPDGIPALIVENAAIPAIEVEANRILVALAGTTAGCRVELRTDRAKSDGGVRDDVLDVVVVTEAGERAYETFSGGERTRLNLALRIALARLLATRRGAESRVLAIDEPEFLDEDGTAALVDVLRGLEEARVFDRVYLVSHVPALRDSFDVVLQVVKDESGRSRVEGQLEAVAA